MMALIIPYFSRKNTLFAKTSANYFCFIVRYSAKVKIALAVQDTSALSQTPLSSKKGVITNSDAIGNTRVPKSEMSIERAGRSSAVKYEEKQTSTQPVIYENEKSFIPTTLTAKSSVSSGFTNRGATSSPAKNIKMSDSTERNTEPKTTRLNIALALWSSPAP